MRRGLRYRVVGCVVGIPWYTDTVYTRYVSYVLQTHYVHIHWESECIKAISEVEAVADGATENTFGRGDPIRSKTEETTGSTSLV